jgi:hypothetical protein
MKPFAILTIALTAAFSITAQEKASIDTDTIKVINNPNYVTISRNGTSTTISASYNDNISERIYNYTTDVNPNDGSVTDNEPSFDLDLPFLKEKSSKNTAKLKIGFMKGMYIGVMMPQSSPYGFRTGWDVGFGELISLDYSLNKYGLSFNTGLGIFDKYFRIKNYARVSSDFGIINVIPVDENVNEAKSHLALAGFQLPLMLCQRIKDITISVGGTFYLNTYMTGAYCYKIGNIKTNESYKGLHQKPLTIDLNAAVTVSDFVGVYVRYSPMSMFRDGYGPKFKTLYSGITFNF